MIAGHHEKKSKHTLLAFFLVLFLSLFCRLCLKINITSAEIKKSMTVKTTPLKGAESAPTGIVTAPDVGRKFGF